ncbi:PREDICTED: BTB/POZ domain-containing protein 9-like isoform X2 [Priapulus caudatus]|uniref:BTB/POZ domain-containing protein 9 n=1 Tax=Priapulus caudatus TaxID=37621 RepID=A0ABM1E7T4_PRICU|nr:PREDICTED: BTB/POZ domain-containing protein 9-like isoform X2 [Priapulus caudatus]
MCDRRTFLSSQSLPEQEVDHVSQLSENLSQLFLNEEYSDITLQVEGQSFPGHRVILGSRSDYFRALLYGGMKESTLSTVELKATSAVPFRMLLKYIYTGRMNLSSLKEDLLLDVLGLANQYGFKELEASISDYLKAILSVYNVCMIYDVATLFSLTSLRQTCFDYMDRQAQEVLSSDAFTSISANSLHVMISRDSFCANEIDIFRAVLRWTKVNSSEKEGISEILNAIRLPLMTLPDLLNEVRPTGLMQPDAILDAIKERVELRVMELNYRGILLPEENVASLRHGAQVLQGEVKTALLDGDTLNYDMDHGFTRHPIEDSVNKGIVVKLGTQCIVNHMRLLLWDKDMRSYSYYIEVSMDEKDWVKVGDHSKYLCRSWQRLYFTPRVIRFVRVVGTHNTVNRVFHLVALEAMHTKDTCETANGLIVPCNNIATIQQSAMVIEGVSRCRNALINGDTQNYDWDSGYTCHQLGSGAIVVQLTQPYLVDSMRMLLWDCDNRTYCYYIEVSIDNQTWDVVCDRSKQPCQSWQMIKFSKRPVVFIRIVGTHNTANEVFHVVHFECPASPEPESCNSPSGSNTRDRQDDVVRPTRSEGGASASSLSADNAEHGGPVRRETAQEQPRPSALDRVNLQGLGNQNWSGSNHGPTQGDPR